MKIYTDETKYIQMEGQTIRYKKNIKSYTTQKGMAKQEETGERNREIILMFSQFLTITLSTEI